MSLATQQVVLDRYSNYLNEISQWAYQDIHLVSCPTLSQNPYTRTQLLQNMIDGKKPSPISFPKLIISALHFYLKNFYLFTGLILIYVYKFFRMRRNVPKVKSDEIILIDTYFGDKELSMGNVTLDKYFMRLYEYLEKSGKEYFIIPKFVGMADFSKYVRFTSLFINDVNVKSVLDLELLRLGNILEILCFIVLYPYKIFRLMQKVNTGDAEMDGLFKNDLCYSLKGTYFYPYYRYLYGRNLSRLFSNKKIKLISWCEYQVPDKNLYKGIRFHGDNVKIYGTQFFLKFPTYRCLYIPETDKKLGISPDVILVSGKYYLPKLSEYEYRVGPSFRYQHIYNQPVNISEDYKIIVMLPYLYREAQSIIQMLKESSFVSNTIDFKLHPARLADEEKIQSLMEEKWSIVEAYPSNQEYAFVISTASGSLLELATIGISALVIETPGFTTTPFPEEGKGFIWESVQNAVELDEKFALLTEKREKNQNELLDYCQLYKNSFFSNVNDKMIEKNFDFA